MQKHRRQIKRYTDREIAVIKDTVAQYPTNLQVAFEQAAQELGNRTKSSVSAFYYGTLRNSNEPMFAVGSRRGVMINRKESRRVTPKPRLRAFDVALMAVDQLTQDELKQLVIHMLNIK